MKRRSMLLAVVMAALLLPLAAWAQVLDPVVSTDWLEKNLGNAKLVMVDVRKVEDYKAGHIPGAVNVFYGTWAIKKGDLLNELPPADDLADAIGGAGIAADSWVVLIGNTAPPPARFDMTRVAWTLKYMGVDQVAILDGGQEKWVKEKKALSQDMVRPKARPFKGKMNKGLFVSKAYVADRLGKAVIVDVRAPAAFEGKEKLPFVPKTGRIKGAVNLPVSALYTPEGLYKSKDALAALASKAAGTDPGREIILYCDTGKTCTSWAFVMSSWLGYRDVKIYDGSFMEWAKDSAAPMEP
ncbi:MAG: sulfurtransferase [Syntrophaceae bacterium]|nr:sulfurtransferase [Syntrophaceae bacterium]